MFILYAVVLGIVLGYAAKGKIVNISKRPLYWKLLPAVALAIQLVIFSKLELIKTLPVQFIVIFHLVSYILLIVFLIKNINNSGIAIAGTGIFLNSLVIFMNGGYMPAIPDNVKNTSFNSTAELINRGETVNNSIKLTNDTFLPWLGDIFHMPSWMPFSNVFSIGDVLIAAGICVYIIVNMRPVKE